MHNHKMAPDTNNWDEVYLWNGHLNEVMRNLKIMFMPAAVYTI